MKRMVCLGAAVACLTLSACGPTPVWTHDSLSPAAWQRDRYECERDARMSVWSFGGGIYGAIEAHRFQARCLESKGYYRVAR